IYLDKGIELTNGNDIKFIKKKCICLRELRRFNDSLILFKQLIDCDPNNCELRYEYSKLLWLMQNYNEAIIEIKNSLQLSQQDIENFINSDDINKQNNDELFNNIRIIQE